MIISKQILCRIIYHFENIILFKIDNQKYLKYSDLLTLFFSLRNILTSGLQL